MKQPFSQGLDSNHIRQGLMSIRNTQIELLNQLKTETQILRKYPPIIVQQEKQINQMVKWEDNVHNLNGSLSLTSQQNSSKLNDSMDGMYPNERGLKQQIDYLKNENRLLSMSIQKTKSNYQLQKDKAKDLQIYQAVTSKLYYQTISQLIQRIDFRQIRKSLEGQIQVNTFIKNRYKGSYFQKIIYHLIEKEKIEESQSRSQIIKDKNIASQLIELKSQISLLLRPSQVESNLQAQAALLRVELTKSQKIIQEQATLINRLEQDKKQVSNFWEKQRVERKKIFTQWERLKKQSNLWQQKQKKIIFYAKDMENKQLRSEKLLKEKEKIEELTKENIRKLSETVSLLREDNERLRTQIRQIEEGKQSNYKQELKFAKQTENQLRTKINQMENMLMNSEKELNSLQRHLSEVKKNHQSMMEMEKRNKENQTINQEVYWRKVQSLKTNSTIDHLWEVKQIQYENITELIRDLKK